MPLLILAALTGCTPSPSPTGLGGGGGAKATVRVDMDGDGVEAAFDCDDHDVTVGTPVTWYRDLDQDGVGEAAYTRVSCTQPRGFARVAGDCDDGNAAVGAPWVGGSCAAPYGACDGAASLVLVPGDAATVPAAVAMAAPGDTICVAPGTWAGAVDFDGKGLQIVGAGGAGVTTLDAQGANSVLTLMSGEPDGSGASGLTLTGGDGIDGGALQIRDLGSRVAFSDLVLVGNRCEDDGGAVYMHGADGDFDAIEAYDNEAHDSGGAFRVVSADVTLTGSWIHDNAAGGSGGGFFARESTVAMSDVVIERNTSGENGGGLEMFWTDLALSDAWIIDNTAAGAGGGIEALRRSQLELERVWIEGNEAGLDGGGISMERSFNSTLRAVVLLENAADGDGAGLAIAETCTLAVSNLSVVGNVAGGYGAVALGGGCSESGTSATFLNNVVAFNTGNRVGGAFIDPTIAITIGYNDTYANGVNWMGVPNQTGTRGNLAVAPSFVIYPGAPDADLHLTAGSALHNVGDPSLLDADGSRSDMGAYGGPSGAW